MITELRALFLKMSDHTGKDPAQEIGPDVRAREPKDLLRGAERNETTKNVRDGRIVDPRDEFSVRKGPGAAGAELDIGAGVEYAGAAERVDRRDPFGKRSALFEYDRAVAVFGKQQRGKQPRGAASDDHGTLGKTLFGFGRRKIRLAPERDPIGFQDVIGRRGKIALGKHRNGKTDILPPPGVDRAAKERITDVAPRHNTRRAKPLFRF